MELDLELLDMLIQSAVTTDHWSANNNTFWKDVANAHSAGSDQSVQRKAGAAAGRIAGSYIGSFFGPIGGLIGRGQGGKIGDELVAKYNK